MSDRFTDYKSEIEMWADMWDEAQSDETFVEPAVHQPDPAIQSNDAQDIYFRYLDKMAGNEDTLLHEEKTPNPVYPDSVGQDGVNPKPAWVREDLLKDVQSIKDDLFELENKMAELGGVPDGPRGAKVMQFGEDVPNQIVSLRKKLEKVSSQLGIENEPSPWEVEASDKDD